VHEEEGAGAGLWLEGSWSPGLDWSALGALWHRRVAVPLTASDAYWAQAVRYHNGIGHHAGATLARDKIAMAHREGTTRISRWFSREQWGRHHAGEHQARMLWVWDDLADESQPRIVQRRDNRGIIELLLTIEVFYCATGGT
jgi:hypothetical protein